MTMTLIFDCDGVLVDSEIIACRIASSMLDEAGFAYAPADVQARFVGMSVRSMTETIAREHGRPIPVGFIERLLQATLAAFEGELRAIPGVGEAVGALDQPRCVASGSSLPRIRRSLALTGLATLFGDNLFSATMVERGKPAPDLFLFAASRMKADPASCLVVEDSVTGVAGARAAGMAVLGFVGGRHCGHDHAQRLSGAGARLVFDDMAELPGLIMRIVAS
jgi:HAD superfamily hydrolase (TIGR01509 family)